MSDGTRPPNTSGAPPKWTAAEVRAMRAEYALRKSTRSAQQMAKDHGTSSSAVEQMLRGLTYKWVR